MSFPPIINSDDWAMLLWRMRNKWVIAFYIDEYGIEWAEQTISSKGDFTPEHYLNSYETNNNN